MTGRESGASLLHPARRRAIRRRLSRWYAASRRELPWRGEADPYRVWVSEIMLQQTTVAAVTPYWTRFIDRFPDLASLADASEEDVLAAWSGLGYYRRARSLLAAAREVRDSHGGCLPRTVEELRRLPGIGAYTAAAIASISWGLPAAAVDGNVSRVLARVELVEGDAGRQPARGVIERLAVELVDPESPGDHNQALMELGATICRPRSPGCGACPLGPLCRARAARAVERVPAGSARPRTIRVLDAVAVVRGRCGRVLLRRVPGGERNAGLLELPAVTLARGRRAERIPRELDRGVAAKIASLFVAEHGFRVAVGSLRGRVSHAITRHSIRALVVDAELVEPLRVRTPWAWAGVQTLGDRAVTGLTRKVARLLAPR